jgi:uncharacterized membrane protein
MKIKVIIIIALLILIIDGIYLFLFGNKFREMIQNIQKEKFVVRIISVVLCYTIIIFGLYYFIIKDNRSIYDAFLFGFVTYGIYDTTNYATFVNWKWNLALMDTIWGGILFALTTYLYKKISYYL